MDQLRAEVTQVLNSFNSVSLNGEEEDKRGEDGEWAATRDRDEAGVLAVQRQRLSQQEGQLDAISGIVQNIKYETQNFDQEVTYQNRMLDRVSADIDRNQEKMVRVDRRLQGLMRQTNHCWLWAIIVCELLFLIIIVL